MTSRAKGKAQASRLEAVETVARPIERLDDWSPGLLKSQAYDQILLDIIMGELQPGERIDEQMLARRYRCGLAGIRDALARLALEDLVQRRSRVGTTVAPLDILEVKQSFEARYLIEPHCAGLAAMHATRADIAAIKSAFDGAEAAISRDDYRKLVAMDQAFHTAVATASHNRTLAKMVVTLHNKAARFWVVAMTARPKKERIEDLAMHRALTRAIEARNVEAAQKAMLVVLGEFPDNVKRTLETTVVRRAR
jgi:DNA-binding GntR family transcriptional regulator